MGERTEPGEKRSQRRRAGKVTVRLMSDPKPGWTLDAALEVLAQGYTVTSTAQRTGFHPGHLRTAARARSIDVRE